MMDFLKSATCQFGNWAIPIVFSNSEMGRFVSEHPDFDEKTKAA
jgi:hypothetical protein